MQRLRRRRVNGGAQPFVERQRHWGRYDDARATCIVVNVCAVMIAMAGLAVVTRAEVVDPAAGGMLGVVMMVMVMVMLMVMRLITVIMRMDGGSYTGTCRRRKAHTESRSNSKHQRQSPP